MMRISVWHRDLSDSYLRQVTQVGADAVDFGQGDAFPGVKETGVPDLDGVLEVKRTLRSWGLAINRVTLPDISAAFMLGQTEDETDIEHACEALRVFGEAGVPIANYGMTIAYSLGIFERALGPFPAALDAYHSLLAGE